MKTERKTLIELQLIHESKHGIEDIRRSWRGEQKYIHARIDFSKHAYRLGYTQKEIARFLGHADPSTVSRYIRSDSGKVRPGYESRKKQTKKAPSMYNKMKTFFKRFL
jgi:hypothetical protein